MPKTAGQESKYRREDFVRTAKRLFLEKGYEATTVVDILEGTSDPPASPSVFYAHFHSKAELYEVALQEIANDYLLDLSPDHMGTMTTPQAEQEIIRMLIVMARFFFACRRLGTMSGSVSRRVGEDMLDYLSVRNEKIIAHLISLLPWKERERMTGTLPQMVTGGILQVADNLLHRRSESKEDRPILVVAMEVADGILRIARSPEESCRRILDGFEQACTGLFTASENALQENAGRRLTVRETLDLLRDLSYLADMVRVVDPAACTVLILEADGTVTRGARCFDIWGICTRCDNCIGQQAVTDGCRREKYEVHDRLVYHITSIPILLCVDREEPISCQVESCSITSAENWLRHTDGCAPGAPERQE